MTEPQPEFSRPFALDKLGHAAVTEHLTARPDERAALARRFGLLALDRLEAELTVAWQGGGTLLALDGWLKAEAVQRCVVTLEPVPQKIEESLHLRFSRHLPAADEAEEEGLDPEAPEPLPPGGLDLGEEVAQALSLALDPYPRAPGATLPESSQAVEEGPFAKLKALKGKE